MRSADGARAWGMLETKTAAKNAMLIGIPAASWMPKINDSGTPSTTEPSTIPSGPPPPPASSPPKRSSMIRSATRKIPAPTKNHSATSEMAIDSGTRSNATAAMSAPAPMPARIPTIRSGMRSTNGMTPLSSSEDCAIAPRANACNMAGKATPRRSHAADRRRGPARPVDRTRCRGRASRRTRRGR